MGLKTCVKTWHIIDFSLSEYLLVLVMLFSVSSMGSKVGRALLLRLTKYIDNSLKIFPQLHGGYTIKLLLTNCSFQLRKIFKPQFFVRASFHSVRTSKLRSEYFAVWTSQLVNKSIVMRVGF